MAYIIGVHSGDQRPLSHIEPAVECRDDPKVGLKMNDAESRVPAREAFEDFASLVRGAVIDGDNFYMAVGLTQQALDGLF
jgi:hypothetical protein